MAEYKIFCWRGGPARLIDSESLDLKQEIFAAMVPLAERDGPSASASAPAPDAPSEDEEDAIEDDGERRHPNSYAPSTRDEEDRLKALHAEGRSSREMSQVLGRKSSAIRKRLVVLGLA